MEPFDRFKKSSTEGNLWIYILSLGEEETVCNEDARRLIFEKFGFLPGSFLLRRVLYRLQSQGYITAEKYKGKKAYQTTEKGKKELENVQDFFEELLRKIGEEII